MHVNILIDRSGSMSSLWAEAIGSVNAYVKELKGKVHIRVVTFDDSSYDVIRDCSKKAFKPIGSEESSPRGLTPLYDSVAKLVTQAEIDNDEKTVVVVMTDGHENASKEWNKNSIKAKLASIEKRGWATVFLGANFDAVETVSSSLGVSAAYTANFAKGNMTRGMSSLAEKTMAYSSAEAGSLAAATAMMYSNAEKADLNKSSDNSPPKSV